MQFSGKELNRNVLIELYRKDEIDIVANWSLVKK